MCLLRICKELKQNKIWAIRLKLHTRPKQKMCHCTTQKKLKAEIPGLCGDEISTRSHLGTKIYASTPGAQWQWNSTSMQKKVGYTSRRCRRSTLIFKQRILLQPWQVVHTLQPSTSVQQLERQSTPAQIKYKEHLLTDATGSGASQ